MIDATAAAEWLRRNFQNKRLYLFGGRAVWFLTARVVKNPSGSGKCVKITLACNPQSLAPEHPGRKVEHHLVSLREYSSFQEFSDDFTTTLKPPQ